MEERTELSPEARALRNAERREYYRKNRERILKQSSEWRKAHPENVRQWSINRWENKLRRMKENEITQENSEQKEN